MRQIRQKLSISATAQETRLHEDVASILGLLRVADHPASLRAYTKEAETEVSGEELLSDLPDSKEMNEEIEYED